MGMAAYRVFDSVDEFSNFLRPDHRPIGEMQVCGLGRVFEAKGKREWYLGFYGVTDHSGYRESPLANSLDRGIQEERIT